MFLTTAVGVGHLSAMGELLNFPEASSSTSHSLHNYYNHAIIMRGHGVHVDRRVPGDPTSRRYDVDQSGFPRRGV